MGSEMCIRDSFYFMNEENAQRGARTEAAEGASAEEIQKSAQEYLKRIPYMDSSSDEKRVNACIEIMGDPFSFTNDLVVHPDTQQFLSMRNEEIANLVPDIRFFKVFRDDLGKESTTHIYFDTDAAADLKNYMDHGARGMGVGIEKFEVKLIGTNPFSAKKDMTGKLTIFASNFAELIRPRGSAGQRYRYVDLAMKTGGTSNREAFDAKYKNRIKDDLHSEDFSIRAVVGVRSPNSTVAGNDKLRSALQRNSFTLEMTPTIHEFNFEDDGTLKFVVNFKPYINDHFSTTTYDVFADNEHNKFMLADKIVTKAITQECTVKALANFKKEQVEALKELRENSLASLLARMRDSGFMRSLYLPNNLLDKINKEGPLFDYEELKKAKIKIMTTKGVVPKEKIKEAMSKKEKLKKNTKQVERQTLSVNQNEIAFIYLSDLVDGVLEQISDYMNADNFNKLVNEVKADKTLLGTGDRKVDIDLNSDDTNAIIQDIRKEHLGECETFKRLRYILGPVELVNPLDPTDVALVSLGDIPISVSYFTEFLTAEVLEKSRFQFPLDQFLDKLINKLVFSFLNDDTCFGGAVKQNTKLRRNSYLAYGGRNYGSGRFLDPLTLQRFATWTYGPWRAPMKSFKRKPIIDAIGSEASRMGFGERCMYVVFSTFAPVPIEQYIGDLSLIHI